MENTIDLKNAFPGQEEKEEVFVFVRRHPLSFLPFILLTALMFVVIPIILIVIFKLFPDFISGGNLKIIIAAVSVYLLFLITFFLVGWLDFYYDIHIVTNKRIVDIDQNGLFSRSVHELTLENVEDVSARINGILATFFQYGDVEIQTAGSRPNFIFDKIPNPRKVAEFIIDLNGQVQRGVAEEERKPTSNLSFINGELMDLKTREIKPFEETPINPKSVINPGEFLPKQ